ncbi:MAG: hypothetical protein M1379_05300, partial [Firmicutes bacterium]|nr:hypothetical protein [Bacillota bacterium]
LRTEVKVGDDALRGEIATLRTEVKVGDDALRTEIRAGYDKLHSEMVDLRKEGRVFARWVFGLMISMVIGVIATAFRR